MLWTSPELLRKTGGKPVTDGGTPKGDVFSFAIILHEMLFKLGPWYTEEELEPKGTHECHTNATFVNNNYNRNNRSTDNTTTR
jgi:hypothetical protein